ncbi:hypothetical protein PIB30_093165 [Stylosanthes scabra]|uniref:Uncharacterized protein n=1 Tax=Stylosanthes scabra TaxID=79078 RepID=A0ABU6WV32_9FABA|nr:hypothetical protein [Stylosanthes scabra]
MVENPQGSQRAVVQEVASAQMRCELPDIYRWVTRDMLGSPPILGQEYLDELKLFGIIFGVPNWLWMNEVMFTEFGIRVPFYEFQQRLLNRASVAPSQFHPNTWSAIRYFEFLELPQDPEVFLFLFTFFSLNTEGKSKKGYISVRLGKYRKILSCMRTLSMILKISDSGMDYVLVTYRGLNAEQKDTADILVKLFSKWNLEPKFVLSRQSEVRKAIVKMVENDVTLERLRRLLRPSPLGSALGASGRTLSASVPPPNVPRPASVSRTQAFPEGGGSSNAGGGDEPLIEVSSPLQEEIP